MLNLVFLTGELCRPAQAVELPSGDRLLSLEVTVRPDGGPAEAVPVQWSDPPGWALGLEAGTTVAVLGRVRRRFFRSGGTTQSRTEVVARRVVRASARTRVRALVEEAVEALDRELAAGNPTGA